MMQELELDTNFNNYRVQSYIIKKYTLSTLQWSLVLFTIRKTPEEPNILLQLYQIIGNLLQQ